MTTLKKIYAEAYDILKPSHRFYPATESPSRSTRRRAFVSIVHYLCRHENELFSLFLERRRLLKGTPIPRPLDVRTLRPSLGRKKRPCLYDLSYAPILSRRPRMSRSDVVDAVATAIPRSRPFLTDIVPDTHGHLSAGRIHFHFTNTMQDAFFLAHECGHALQRQRYGKACDKFSDVKRETAAIRAEVVLLKWSKYNMPVLHDVWKERLFRLMASNAYFLMEHDFFTERLKTPLQLRQAMAQARRTTYGNSIDWSDPPNVHVTWCAHFHVFRPVPFMTRSYIVALNSATKGL